MPKTFLNEKASSLKLHFTSTRRNFAVDPWFLVYVTFLILAIHFASHFVTLIPQPIHLLVSHNRPLRVNDNPSYYDQELRKA